MPSWLTSTASKPRSSLDGDEIIRLVDDPNGTPRTGSTTIDDIRAYASGFINVASYGAVDASDAAPAINEALAEGEYRTVFVPNGTYNLGSPLVFGRGTRLLCESPTGVRFVRTHTGRMVNNGLNYTTSSSIEAYAGNGGIVIEGGIWDFWDGVSSLAGSSAFAIGYAAGFTLRDVTLRNMIGGHGLDLSASSDVLIERCRFLGYALNGGSQDLAEMLQIDANLEGSFPSFGVPVFKPNKRVVVRDCYFGANPDNADVRFTAPPKVFGSHASVYGEWAEDITFERNIVEDASFAGVYIWKWKNVFVRDNIFRDCKYAIVLKATTAGTESSKNVDRTQTNQTDGSVDGLFTSGNVASGCEYFLYMNEITWGTDTEPRHKRIRMRGDEVTGNTGAAAMNCRDARDVKVFDLTIDGCVRGVSVFGSTQRNEDIDLVGLTIRNATMADEDDGALYLSDAINVRVIRPLIEDCAGKGIFISETTPGRIDHPTIRNCGRNAIYGESNAEDWIVTEPEIADINTTGLDVGWAAIGFSSSCDRIHVKGGTYDVGAELPILINSPSGNVDIALPSSPSGTIRAPVGSRIMQIGGTYGSTLWVKESGGNTSSGWVAPGLLTPRQIYHSAVAQTHTGDTSETTKITTTIAGGSIGANGRLIFRPLVTCNANDADSKLVRTYINGTLINTVTLTSTRSGEFEVTLSNRNSTSSQVAKGPTHASAYSTSAVATSAHTFDTTADMTVTVTLTLGSAADSLTIEAFTIEAVYGV